MVDNPTVSKGTLIDKAVNAAKDLPSLITQFKAIDPTLAKQLQGKALIASKSVWVTLLTPAVTFLATKYGLGWDNDTIKDVAVGLTVAAATIMRYISVSPITGIFKAKSVKDV